MLTTILTVIQVIASILLILAVMLHSAKGEGLGAIGSAGGGGVFGSQKGVEAGLNRLTTAIVVVWALVGLTLAYLSYHH